MTLVWSVSSSHTCCPDYKTQQIFPNRSVGNMNRGSDTDLSVHFKVAPLTTDSTSTEVIELQPRDFFNEIYKFENIESITFFGSSESEYYNSFLSICYPCKAYITDGNEVVDVSRESIRAISARGNMIDLCKNCERVGVLVDFVNDDNRPILEGLRALFSPEIRFYYFSVGVIEDYKLGNFPDVEIFISFKCNLCFDMKKRYCKPVVTPFEFFAAQLDCFWEFRHGDIGSLLKKYSEQLLQKTQVRGYLASCPDDFKERFSCPASEQGADQNSSFEIGVGATGVPMAYSTIV